MPNKISARVAHPRTKEELLAEVDRIGHELISRARAVKTSPHPHLALEQLAAELEVASHLAAEVKHLASRPTHFHT